MSETFRYRLRTPGGGLAANLSAQALTSLDAPAHRLRIHRDVYLAAPGEIYWLDLAWLSFGLRLHAEYLSTRHKNGLVVKVLSLDFPLSDYRSEVAALAMDGWVRQACNAPDIGARARYDQERARVTFDWGIPADPFDGVTEMNY
ncbi:hypothetical protein [Streptomyces sp. NPDC003077]|uniref:hypothetical protein n=1 Tax=Streptomyces sp. NPDC003077 TaxID=3154443 RepID=UPI0033B90DC1